MRLRDTVAGWTGRTRARRLAVAVAIVAIFVAAFVAGLAYRPWDEARILAEDRGASVASQPVVTAVAMMHPDEVPPIEVIVSDDRVPLEPLQARTTAGSPTKPESGNFLYLPLIDRYFSLPDDVELIKNVTFGSCIPGKPCPVFPFLVYRRGDAIIGIDQMGDVFDHIGENADASAFPFFTGEEIGGE